MKPRTLSLEQLPLRPELIGEQPYGAPQLDVPVRLNVNENPYPPSSRLRAQLGDAVARAAKELNRYPDREARDLRADLAAYLGFGLTVDNVWAANGSNEVMSQLLGAFGGPDRSLLAFSPSYSMYPEYARNTHTAYIAYPRRADFTLDADLVAQAIAQHSPNVIVIANPNNPTGTRIPVSEIDAILRVTGDAIVIIDEAYQEFTEYPEDSALALLPAYPRLVVTRTMSKAFAFAGGRLGYLAAGASIIDACRIVRLPYHLSTQTQVMARVALANASELLGQVNLLRTQCQRLQRWLRAKGCDVPPSDANFCLFGPFTDAHRVWKSLLEAGVLVREVGPKGYLRVTSSSPEELDVFKEALNKLLVDGTAKLIEPENAG
jgi:histidinol-phosphate aminotransferase